MKTLLLKLLLSGHLALGLGTGFDFITTRQCVTMPFQLCQETNLLAGTTVTRELIVVGISTVGVELIAHKAAKAGHPALAAGFRDSIGVMHAYEGYHNLRVIHDQKVFADGVVWPICHCKLFP